MKDLRLSLNKATLMVLILLISLQIISGRKEIAEDPKKLQTKLAVSIFKKVKEMAKGKNKEPSTYQCFEEIEQDKTCYSAMYIGGEIGNEKFYMCNKTNRELCFQQSTLRFECGLGIFNFTGEPCDVSAHCYQGHCDENHTCSIANTTEGEPSLLGKECGRNQYFDLFPPTFSSTCLNYLLEENDSCENETVHRFCSPQFECVNHKCVKRGSKALGSAVKKENEAICKSFYVKDGHCSTAYKAETEEDEARIPFLKAAAELFEKVDFDNEDNLLASYDNLWYGNFDIFRKGVDIMMEEEVGDALDDCLKEFFYSYLLTQYLFVTRTPSVCYSIAESDIKKYVDGEYEPFKPTPQKKDDNGGLSGGAIAGIVIGAIVLIIIVAILIHRCKNREDF